MRTKVIERRGLYHIIEFCNIKGFNLKKSLKNVALEQSSK